MRLSLVAKKMNVATTTIVERLSAEGLNVENNPNTRLTGDQLQVVANAFDFPELMQARPSAPAPAAAPPRRDDDLPRYFRPEETPAAPEPARPVEAPAPEPQGDDSRLPGLRAPALWPRTGCLSYTSPSPRD